MTRITIKEDGREQVITDVAPYLRERDDVAEKLRRIYAGFAEGSVDILGDREGEIVDLANRYYALGDIVQAFEQAKLRDANILAGWKIVKEHGAGGDQ